MRNDYEDDLKPAEVTSLLLAFALCLAVLVTLCAVNIDPVCRVRLPARDPAVMDTVPSWQSM